MLIWVFLEAMKIQSIQFSLITHNLDLLYPMSQLSLSRMLIEACFVMLVGILLLSRAISLLELLPIGSILAKTGIKVKIFQRLELETLWSLPFQE